MNAAQHDGDRRTPSHEQDPVADTRGTGPSHFPEPAPRDPLPRYRDPDAAAAVRRAAADPAAARPAQDLLLRHVPDAHDQHGHET
ncbi:MAG: hypothetical protein LC789_14615 [Actinobacteria bacterium]|nr:hypothetical protein [Actinomycetota bacterium]MCA1721339.1 hypothetical protein [Actinomycetota bacterium]